MSINLLSSVCRLQHIRKCVFYSCKELVSLFHGNKKNKIPGTFHLLHQMSNVKRFVVGDLLNVACVFMKCKGLGGGQ